MTLINYLVENNIPFDNDLVNYGLLPITMQYVHPEKYQEYCMYIDALPDDSKFIANQKIQYYHNLFNTYSKKYNIDDENMELQILELFNSFSLKKTDNVANQTELDELKNENTVMNSNESINSHQTNDISYSRGKKLSEYMPNYTPPQPKKNIGVWFKLLYTFFAMYHASMLFEFLSSVISHNWFELIFIDICMLIIALFYGLGVFYLFLKLFSSYAYSIFVKYYNVTQFIYIVISIIYGTYDYILFYIMRIVLYFLSSIAVAIYLRDRE